jgi:hypothetical protein
MVQLDCSGYKNRRGFGRYGFSMSITQSCLLSIDALSGLPFKISPELRVSLGTPDTVIAATASLHDSPLLTNNAKDYPMQN